MRNYIALKIHFIFRTKNSEPFLKPNIRKELIPFFAKVGSDYQMPVLMSGGVEDHMHLLVSLPSRLATGDAAQYLKGSSSRWINKKFPEIAGQFSWQTGYGAFSVSISDVEKTKNYIAHQPKHHQEQSFNDELEAIRKKHGITES
jgi:Transposase and inactivated derivatives